MQIVYWTCEKKSSIPKYALFLVKLVKNPVSSIALYNAKVHKTIVHLLENVDFFMESNPSILTRKYFILVIHSCNK